MQKVILLNFWVDRKEFSMHYKFSVRVFHPLGFAAPILFTTKLKYIVRYVDKFNFPQLSQQYGLYIKDGCS